MRIGKQVIRIYRAKIEDNATISYWAPIQDCVCILRSGLWLLDAIGFFLLFNRLWNIQERSK